MLNSSADLSTSYVPIEQNQFLYASAPVRVLLASLAGIRWLMVRGGDPAVHKKRNALLAIMLYDGLGGLLLGWYLGSFDGRVPGYKL